MRKLKLTIGSKSAELVVPGEKMEISDNEHGWMDLADCAFDIWLSSPCDLRKGDSAELAMPAGGRYSVTVEEVRDGGKMLRLST